VTGMVRLRAHAKINLALRVGPLGDDGFHPLATVFQTLSLCDLLYGCRAERVAAGGGCEATGTACGDALLRLRVDGAELPADNTVSRAVALFADEVRARGIEPARLHVRLVKRAPLGAGLGGGSSDAVAALAMCARLWNLGDDLSQWSDALQRIAARVGSDVPFFLHGGTAMGTGRGARVEPLEPLEPTWFAVAAPAVHMATPEAYAALDRCTAEQPARDAPRVGVTTPETPELPAYQPHLSDLWMGNDLARPVAALHPQIEQVRQRLLELGAASAQMTGSGAASFGAFAGRAAAARAARALRAEGLWGGAFVSITGSQHRRCLFGPGVDLQGPGV